MSEFITEIKKINRLIKQDKLYAAKKEFEELKKSFSDSLTIAYLEHILNCLPCEDLEKLTIQIYSDSRLAKSNDFKNSFFTYHLIKNTKFFDTLFEKKRLPENFIDDYLSGKNRNIDKIDVDTVLVLQLYIIGIWLFDLLRNDRNKLQQTIKKLYKLGFTPNELQTSLFSLKRELKAEWIDYEPTENDSHIFWDLMDQIAALPVNEIDINNYFSIDNIQLKDLNDKKEIYFLGENGDGKTILLQAILLSLKGNTGNEIIFSFINQNENFQSKIDKSNKSLKLEAKVLNTFGYDFKINHKEQEYNYQSVFAYGVNRLRKNEKEADTEGYLTLFNSDTYLTSPVQWLKDVQLDYWNYINKLKNNQLSDKDIEPISPEQAVGLLEQVINFENDTSEKKFRITINGSEIKFIEKQTQLKFEQLSDGYKSILILLSDLLSRLSKTQLIINDVKNYTGIVIIDELGVFLHPKWEFSLARNLRKLFPNIQWIFSTHSPIAILGASEDALFYKVYKNKGITEISKAFTPEMFSDRLISGFLTSQLFDMPTAKPAAYRNRTKDYETGEHIYSIIHKEVKKRLEKEPLQNHEVQEIVSNLLDKFENNQSHEKNK